MNYALYLQTALKYEFVDMDLILDWYELCHNYADKFSIGDYSLWSDIFFIEFYQENEAELKEKRKHYRIHFPDHQQYYYLRWDKAVNNENCYLKVAFLLCYFRFLKSLPNIANIIIHYLNQDKTVKKELLADHYRPQIEEIYEYEDKLAYNSINTKKLLLPYAKEGSMVGGSMPHTSTLRQAIYLQAALKFQISSLHSRILLIPRWMWHFVKRRK